MFLFNFLKRKGKRKKKLKTERGYSYGLEPIQNLAITLEREREVKVLLEAYQKKGDRNVSIAFKYDWRMMDTLDQIETLVSIEKDIAQYRKEICNELAKQHN
mgnify:CR=1 FL=1